jgi:hypothetical protein
MTEAKNLQLAVAFFEQRLGQPITELEPVSGLQLAELLFLLNDVFKPHIHQLCTLPYAARFEAQADKAIEDFVYQASPTVWDNLSPSVWRVLLERHQQLLLVAHMNKQTNKPVTSLPVGLPKDARLAGVMLLLFHSMTLPLPISDLRSVEFPDTLLQGSLLRH